MQLLIYIIDGSTKDDYKAALIFLKDKVFDKYVVKLKAIITNRELALINAIDEVFEH